MKTNFLHSKGEKIQGPYVIIQAQHESDGWKRSMTFILDENVYIKNRISELLKYDFDPSLLEEIETFQKNAIKMDDLVRILRNEIAELDKLLIREVWEDGLILKEIIKKVRNIRNNAEYAETVFTKQRLTFNTYMSENIES